MKTVSADRDFAALCVKISVDNDDSYCLERLAKLKEGNLTEEEKVAIMEEMINFAKQRYGRKVVAKIKRDKRIY